MAFLRALVRLGVVLLPEYVVIVLLVGAARGWLLGLADSNHLAAHPAGTALLAAVAGVAMVIPTAGEIPILQPLSLAGVPVGVVGALLVTLPVVSLPGLAMVWRSLGSRVAVATVVLAIVAGLLAAAVLSVIL